jgi:uncharacterized repeat protein (TIGR01451 family)/fimbrial isopeptide formation D2 family protein
MVMKKILLVLLLVCGVLIGGCYSCKTWMKLQGQRPADPSVKFMWEKGCRPAPMPLSAQCELPNLPPSPPVVLNTAARIYPSEGCGVVKLEKIMPNQVQTGTEFEYKIRVTNLTGSALADVVVTDTLSSNFQYKTSNPQANVQGNKLVWVFAGLGPKETKEITGIAVAAASGIVRNSADVTYRMPLSLQAVSIQPIVSITKTAPAEVSVCDLINCTLRVENTGTGPANNVKIIDDLPSGLVTVQGSSRVEIPIGTLLAGTARDISVAVKAQKSGRYTNNAAVFADGINVRSPQVLTIVRQPILNIVKTGPEMQYIDREVAYEIYVTNTGDWPAVNTLIEDEIPAGAAFVKASQGGVLVQNRVMWKVAKLNPGATAETSVTYMPRDIGTVVDTVRASAVCAEVAAVTAKTEVRGVPAVLLEVIDLADPIRIGNNTTYRIMVTNQGSAVAANIAVKAVLEPQMEYVSSVGATNGALAGDTVTFAPLPSLAPKSRATWEVSVKAKAVGDVRFKAIMKCDQLDRDVMETESTDFYE